MISHRTLKIIAECAKAAGVDPMLAISIAEVESCGDQYAIRFEPGWKWFPPDAKIIESAKRCRITVATERMLLASSIGIMQCMGTVARELGFQDNLLMLTDIHIGAKFGCLKLAKLGQILKSESDVIAAYNAGSPIKKPDGTYVNQEYVNKVIAARKTQV